MGRWRGKNGYKNAHLKKSYFEGWYFKQQNGERTIAFIPGIQSDEGGRSSAFVQVITETGAFSAEYPYEQFESRNNGRIQVGQNIFSGRGIRIDIEGQQHSCKGNLRFGPLTPLGHNCMGPFRFIPFLECCHGVISMRHDVEGELHLWDREQGSQFLVFGEGSTGYIERDKGRSFPDRYAWVQCNRFQTDKLEIMASAATVPIFGRTIIGCTCAINFRGTPYPIATFLGAKVICINEKGLEIVQGNKRLIVEAIDENGKPLKAPERGNMNRIIHESPSCRVRFTFSDGGNILFDCISDQASFEYSKA